MIDETLVSDTNVFCFPYLRTLIWKKENVKLREELEYYRNRKMSGRQKHNAKWMAIYNDFVVGYESGMTMIEIAKRNNVSERTIYRYKAYYDELKDKNEMGSK